MRAANRVRKRKLLALQQASPLDAAPGLAVCRALDAVYDGDFAAVGSALRDAEQALGGRS